MTLIPSIHLLLPSLANKTPRYLNSETLDIIGQYYSAETRLSIRLGFDDTIRVKKMVCQSGNN